MQEFTLQNWIREEVFIKSNENISLVDSLCKQVVVELTGAVETDGDLCRVSNAIPAQVRRDSYGGV